MASIPVLPPPTHPSIPPTTGDLNPSAHTPDFKATQQQATVDNAANGIGGTIKGAWNAFHGAGEALRGNIIKGADSIAGTGGDQSTLGANPPDESGEAVAQSGFAEMNRGVQGLKGNSR
ncbi:hypothetical protein FRB96_007129 [Tulasnella sp. 330]|nr:hypothetical protein FRB96_007129 [Tulasnella sp. 330]KAG8876432.1 hypothetical protein FRB97_004169 [Tulasnella sp. 331]